MSIIGSSSPSRALVVLFVAAFLLRLAAVLALRDVTAGPDPLFAADPVEFNQLALNLAGEHGYALGGKHTSFRAPGWPLALAGVYWLLGPNYPAVYVLSCALGAGTCLLAYAIARQLDLGRRAALAAGWLCAVYLPHTYFATLFDSETILVPALGLGVWLFLRHLRSRSWAPLALAGLALGYAALVRPFALLLLPALTPVLLWQAWRDGRRWRRCLTAPLVLAVTFLLVLAPWALRNYAVHGRFVLVATTGGSTFYGSNNDRVLREPRHWGGWVSTTTLPGRDQIDAQPDEVAHDKMEWKLGLAWCRENWRSLPLLGVYKLARLWLPDIDSGNRTYVALQVAGYVPFLLLYLVGMLAIARDPARRASAPWLALHCCILTTVATALIFWGSPRFRDANTPILMAYAALGGQTVLAWLSRRLPRYAAPAVTPRPEDRTGPEMA